jgi:uncharacterized protein YecT (DUF1311 family)
MKKLFFPIFFLAFAPLSASAQNSKQYLDCSHNAQTQAAMNACADQELRRVDPELNGTYRALMAKTAQAGGNCRENKVRTRSLAGLPRCLP